MLNTFQAASITRNFAIPVIRQMPPIHDELLALHMRTSMPRDPELELIRDYLSHLSFNRTETVPEPYSIYKKDDRWWSMGSDGVGRYNHPRLYDVLHELSNNQLRSSFEFFDYRTNNELWINIDSRLSVDDYEFEFNVQLREPLRGKILRDVGDLSHNIVVKGYSFYDAERAAILSVSDDADAFRLIQVVSTEKLRRVYRDRDSSADIAYGSGGRTVNEILSRDRNRSPVLPPPIRSAEDLDRESQRRAHDWVERAQARATQNLERRDALRRELQREREARGRQERESWQEQERRELLEQQERERRQLREQLSRESNPVDDLLAKEPKKKRRNLDL